MGKKKIYETVSKITDINGNASEQSSFTVYRHTGEPNFVKLYTGTVLFTRNLSVSFNPILLALLDRITYANDTAGSQVLVVNKYVKESISKMLKISEARIKQCLTQCVSAGLFKRIATGTYQANPMLFGKGDWKDIEKIRSAFFNFETGEVEPNIEYKIEDNEDGSCNIVERNS